MKGSVDVDDNEERLTLDALGFDMESGLTEAGHQTDEYPMRSGLIIATNLEWAFGDRTDVPESSEVRDYFGQLREDFCEVGRLHGERGGSAALSHVMDELKTSIEKIFAKEDAARILAVLP